MSDVKSCRGYTDNEILKTKQAVFIGTVAKPVSVTPVCQLKYAQCQM